MWFWLKKLHTKYKACVDILLGACFTVLAKLWRNKIAINWLRCMALIDIDKHCSKKGGISFWQCFSARRWECCTKTFRCLSYARFWPLNKFQGQEWRPKINYQYLIYTLKTCMCVCINVLEDQQMLRHLDTQWKLKNPLFGRQWIYHIF